MVTELHTYAGYHRFQSESGPYGSFEVFELTGGPEAGWYWQAGFPGCLPDSDAPTGPFETAESAYRDAMET